MIPVIEQPIWPITRRQRFIRYPVRLSVILGTKMAAIFDIQTQICLDIGIFWLSDPHCRILKLTKQVLIRIGTVLVRGLWHT
jgi:hypothetical protein